jgi:hypothetical protein
LLVKDFGLLPANQKKNKRGPFNIYIYLFFCMWKRILSSYFVCWTGPEWERIEIVPGWLKKLTFLVCHWSEGRSWFCVVAVVMRGVHTFKWLHNRIPHFRKRDHSSHVFSQSLKFHHPTVRNIWVQSIYSRKKENVSCKWKFESCRAQVLEKIEGLIEYIILELTRGCSPKLQFSARCRENTAFDEEKCQIVFKNDNEQHKVTVNFQLSPKQFGKWLFVLLQYQAFVFLIWMMMVIFFSISQIFENIEHFTSTSYGEHSHHKTVQDKVTDTSISILLDYDTLNFFETLNNWRDLYYIDVNFFKSQKCTDSILENLACMLNIPRNSLHIVYFISSSYISPMISRWNIFNIQEVCLMQTASEKGLLVGPLIFRHRGTIIDCNFVNVVSKELYHSFLWQF